MSRPRTPLVAVVGGGAAGALTALAILRRTTLDVAVIEPRPHLGRGVAYSTPEPGHRLNVPSGSLSALPDDPDHFARWALRIDSGAASFSFPSRGHYGVYLSDTLRKAATATARQRLRHVRATAISVQRRDDGWAVGLGPSGELHADQLVLATGVGAPAHLEQVEPAAREHPDYIADPWATDALADLPPGFIVCLGTGLTAVDVAVSAAEWTGTTSVLAVSRHGLRPLAHRSEGSPGWTPRLGAVYPPTALGVLRAARAEAALAEARGLDWRDAVNGLRPRVQELWGTLPDPERRRFADRLGRYWEVHRHRLAPEVARRVGDLERSRRLSFRAAAVESVEVHGKRLHVTLRRPDGTVERHAAAAVVNCTGTVASADRDPLLGRLVSAGLCRRGPLGLGVATDANGAVLDSSGTTAGMFTLGAVRRGDIWETTAIPEIREQAFALALELASAAGPARRAG